MAQFPYLTCGWIFILTMTVVEAIVIAVLATFFADSMQQL